MENSLSLKMQKATGTCINMININERDSLSVKKINMHTFIQYFDQSAFLGALYVKQKHKTVDNLTLKRQSKTLRKALSIYTAKLINIDLIRFDITSESSASRRFI